MNNGFKKSEFPLCKLVHSKEEVYQYATSKIKTAKNTIRHAALAPSIHSNPENSMYKHYEEAIIEKVKDDNLKYRYITIFDNNHDRIDRICQIFSHGSSSFKSAYFKHFNRNLPLFSFILFDEDEIITYYPSYETVKDSFLFLSYSNVGIMYSNYFDLLWSNAEKIENHSKAKAIKDKLSNSL
ncbi:MAG: hypothetical protein HQK92_00860 [Nitrospirae bacterium]|nr:hypothetical protein [Nitrospirota bacterium]